jgi:hypothetical protein
MSSNTSESGFRWKSFAPSPSDCSSRTSNPGTRFLLEQEPVEGRIWLPSHFTTQVKARILFAAKNYTDDETYIDYRCSSPSPSAANAAH